MTVTELGNETTRVVVAGAELVMEREFDAPLDGIWRALTDPDSVPSWWAPEGTTLQVVEMDVRPSGRWHWVIASDADDGMPVSGRYLEVTQPRRLAYTQAFSRPAEDDADDLDATRTTTTLEGLGPRTMVTSRSMFPSAAALDEVLAAGAVAGAIETWDRLEAFARSL